MPMAPPRPCPTCGALRCQRHTVSHTWDARVPVERLRGRKLQQARTRLFQRQPLCEPCQQQGRLTVATLRDHRIPLAEGGTEDEANEQAICYRCHVEKTHAESRRGRARKERLV